MRFVSRGFIIKHFYLFWFTSTRNEGGRCLFYHLAVELFVFSCQFLVLTRDYVT